MLGSAHKWQRKLPGVPCWHVSSYVLSAQSKVKPLARLWIFDCKIPFPPNDRLRFPGTARLGAGGGSRAGSVPLTGNSLFTLGLVPLVSGRVVFERKLQISKCDILDILHDLLSLSSNMAYLVPLLAGWVLKKF